MLPRTVECLKKKSASNQTSGFLKYNIGNINNTIIDSLAIPPLLV